MRGSYSGNTLAFQANAESSILLPRSNYFINIFMSNIKSRACDNVFTLEEIDLLRQDQDSRPVASESNKIFNKNLDYHLEDSVPYKIIRPKLNDLIGYDHEFATGSYKEAHNPYQTHVDNSMYHRNYYSFTNNSKYNVVALIPLVEGPHFNTAFFNLWSEHDLGMGRPLPDNYLTGHSEINLDPFTHISEPARSQLLKIDVDNIRPWKLGSVIFWDRRQLHCSTDFAKHGLVKKFIVMCIA